MKYLFEPNILNIRLELIKKLKLYFDKIFEIQIYMLNMFVI